MTSCFSHKNVLLCHDYATNTNTNVLREIDFRLRQLVSGKIHPPKVLWATILWLCTDVFDNNKKTFNFPFHPNFFYSLHMQKISHSLSLKSEISHSNPNSFILNLPNSLWFFICSLGFLLFFIFSFILLTRFKCR